MFGLMAALMWIAITGFVSYSVGVEDGEQAGRKQMYTQEYSCQTLPDKTIHCWKNKENK